MYKYGGPKDYTKCCDIIEKLEEVDSKELANLCISLAYNYEIVRSKILNEYGELIEDE